MKPFHLISSLIVFWLSAAPVVWAQKPVNEPLPLSGPSAPALAISGPGTFMGPQIWGTVPPPKPLPYGYWWNEYRGADIEHPLYAPRHPHYVQPAAKAPNPLAGFCCWFHRLFHSKCATPTAAPGDVCQAADVPLPPIPPLAPVMPDDPPIAEYDAEAPPLFPVRPQPLNPTPLPDLIATPHAEDTIPPQTLSVTPSVDAASPPAAIIPIPSPAVGRPEPATRSPAPTTITETQPLPVDSKPPAIDGQLPPARSPVVELAPEIPIPRESTAPQAAPRNVIPTPPTGPSVPRNKIPAQKRGNATS